MKSWIHQNRCRGFKNGLCNLGIVFTFPEKEEDVVYDGRTLYDRLKEQKDKKQEEFEESIKFSKQFYAISLFKLLGTGRNRVVIV